MIQNKHLFEFSVNLFFDSNKNTLEVIKFSF